MSGWTLYSVIQLAVIEVVVLVPLFWMGYRHRSTPPEDTDTVEGCGQGEAGPRDV